MCRCKENQEQWHEPVGRGGGQVGASRHGKGIIGIPSAKGEEGHGEVGHVKKVWQRNGIYWAMVGQSTAQEWGGMFSSKVVAACTKARLVQNGKAHVCCQHRVWQYMATGRWVEAESRGSE